MAIFGLSDDNATKTKKSDKSADKSAKKSKKSDDSSQADEAKALLEKMEAKKDADECPFC